jgi:ABC-type enterobactin transport system permease subunit
MFKGIDLETQYKGFNLCFWSMLIIATITALFGSPITATLLGTLGLVSGAISQLKLVLINQEAFIKNQETFLLNQARIDSKLDVLLEEGVQ